MPQLSLEEWEGFLRDHLQQESSGLLTVENSRGIMLAFAAYCVRPDIQLRRCLVADPVIIMDLVGAKMVAELLDQHLQVEAARLNCSGLRLQLPLAEGKPCEERGLSAFRCCGLATDSLRLSKSLLPPQPAA